MRLRQGKVGPTTLAFLAALAVLGYWLVEAKTLNVGSEFAKEKREAVSKTRAGQEAVRAARRKTGMPIDHEHDPSLTGLIGADDGGALTTDQGNLRAKHIATHPNFAAVAVSLLREAGVRRGDVVAVGQTGSFPGANLAVICAIEAIGARPILITSVCSSTWGANQAELSWLDMEKALFDAGVIRTRSVAASIGGDKDKGVGRNKATIDLALAAIQRSGAETIHTKSLVDSIKKRMEIYEREAKGKPIKCYVNIGGGLASIGSSLVGKKLIDTGLTKTYVARNYPTEGVMIRMLRKNVPIIHLLDFPRLAREQQLPLRQAKPGEAGEGPMFMTLRYNGVLVLVTLSLLILITAAAVRLDLRHSLFRRLPPSPAQPPIAPPPAGEVVA